MRFLSIYLIALFGFLASAGILNSRNEAAKRSIGHYVERDAQPASLEKRKGGGGRGGGGGGGSSGGSRGGSGGSSGGGARTGGTSNSGGTVPGGSGSPRSYGGGRYYGGGAAVPYTAGSRTPRGLLPLAFFPIVGLTFFGGAWLYGVYAYPYSNPYRFYNRTSQQNETKPVQCLCQEYSVCGCDDNDDQTFLNNIVGDGSPSSMNSSLIRVATVNGTSQIFLNGTLENGTTADGPDSASPLGLRIPPIYSALALAALVGSALASL